MAVGTLRDNLLPVVDKLRGLPGQLGFRKFQVYARTVTWTGGPSGVTARPGAPGSTKTVSDVRLYVGNGQDPKVRQVSIKDVTAGNPEDIAAQYDIGPLTPLFAGGGVSESTINPQQNGISTEFYIVLKGSGMPPDGLLLERVSESTDQLLRITLRAKSTGRAAT